MNKTNQYYYIENGVVVPPVDVSVNGRHATTNPFFKPNWVGSTSIGKNITDTKLIELNVYPLWTDVPQQPGKHYKLVNGSIVVESDRVTRTDIWEAIPLEQVKESIIQSAQSQIREHTNTEIFLDNSLKWNTDYDLRAYSKLIADLSIAEDLDTFDESLESHPPSDAEYAKHLTLQESEYLAIDSEIRSAEGIPIFSDDERNGVESRISNNTKVSSGLETGVQTPESGAPRESVTLHGEEKMKATFREIIVGSNYIPQVLLPSIPEGTDMSKLFAMVYDENNTFLLWMPFEEVEGKWQTSSDVGDANKTSSSVWGVAVAQNGKTAEDEITSRVRLVPPDVKFSEIRWGGRT